MDTATLFTIVIFIVAVILVAVGVYLILVLHEARYSLKRINHILDHAESVVDIIDTKIARPASSFSGIVVVVKEVIELIKSVRNKTSDGNENGT